MPRLISNPSLFSLALAGLVLLAQACATPVIAYAAGGALETVTERTGIFFQQQTEEGLGRAVEEMENRHSSFKLEEFKKNVSRFSRKRYRAEMETAIYEGYRRWSLER